MYNYISNNFDLFGIDVNNNTFLLYKNEKLVLQGNLKPLKELSLPVLPFEYKDCFVLLDYYKGVKIYKNNIEYFFKFTTIYDVAVINNYIIFFGQKKINIIDINTLEIIKEMTRSENLHFSSNENYALFYRLKNNKSYLIDYVNNKTIQLNNFIKDDVLIHKIDIKGDDLYVSINKKFISTIIKYNLTNFKTEIVDVLGDGDANAIHYYDCFQMTVNEMYKVDDVKSLDYIEFLCYVYKKYGFFMTLYIIDNKKLNEYKDTKYSKIVDIFQNLIVKLNKSKNPIDSNLKLELLKEEIKKSQIEIENLIKTLVNKIREN